jgi:ubiquinone/menaquinone biosynthesis C-methylase UbiE
VNKLYDDVFAVIRHELKHRGFDLAEVDQLLKEFSWFMSPISALRMLLRSSLTLKQFRDSLFFLSHRHEQLAKEIEPNSTVLDIGSGLGLLAVTLAEKNCVVHGTEVLDENVQIARRLAKLRKVDERCTFHKVESTKLPFVNEAFDVAVLSWTLHDIKEEEQDILLSECVRVLKRVGRLLILDQESKLDFARIERLAARFQILKTRERMLSTVFDHSITSGAKLVEYQKRKENQH